MIRHQGGSLRAFNTFGVEATARELVQLDAMSDIARLSGQSFVPDQDLMLGGGSNLLFVGNIPGTVFLNRIRGIHVVDDDGDTVLVDAYGGESWHEFVLWSLRQGLSGLENLSLIPGLVGAAPMQNIGAYGVEISEFLESVEALDWRSGKTVRFSHPDCGFAYRDSMFKSVHPDRYLILACRLRLQRKFVPKLSYAGLREELNTMGVSVPDAGAVSQAVINIRLRKLPNPEDIGNAGSFFKNPVISKDQAELLRARHEGLPVHETSKDQAKLSAAWMIDSCGFKGYRQGDAAVSDRHALVLVNHGCASGLQILELSQKIESVVFEKFGVRLEREPRVVGRTAMHR